MVVGAMGVLALTLIASNLFWAWQLHRLVDKLMSRNYAEYHSVQNPAPTVQNREISVPLPDIQQDLGILNGINVP